MAQDLANAFRATEGMIDLEEFRLLHRLAREAESGCIVEVGAWRGRSSVALGLGSLEGHGVPVFAFDPHEEFVGVLGGKFGPADRAAFYRAMLDSGCWSAVRLVNLSSEQVAPQWDRPIALLWIDGDHSDRGVRRDFHGWLPHLTSDARVAFDDAVNPKLGPARLIRDLLATGLFREETHVGKVTVLARLPLPTTMPPARTPALPEAVGTA